MACSPFHLGTVHTGDRMLLRDWTVEVDKTFLFHSCSVLRQCAVSQMDVHRSPSIRSVHPPSQEI